MIQWLQKYEGIEATADNMERMELETIRKQVKEYKAKYEAYDKEMEVVSSESEELSPEEQKKYDEELKRKAARKNGNRLSISAEAYGIHNIKKPYVPRVIPKNEDQIRRIKEKCLQSFIFNSLEDKELKTVIDSFEEKKCPAGKNIITQGEEGDVLYLVDSGELDCEKVFKAGDPPTYLKTYKPGESFGELALLYNAPRAATIRAKTDSILWALDRECFNNIVKDAAIKRREKYENTLKKVEILKSIDPYELGQISDALKTAYFKKGDKIIKQNDKGDVFYILDEGICHAEKVFEEGKEAENVKDYKSCDYFGELALLKGEPRAATIVADSDCKLLSLDRMAFKRLLGPLENILKRNSENYVKYMKK
jgi:cAMP-dependent protein kinase regulator